MGWINRRGRGLVPILAASMAGCAGTSVVGQEHAPVVATANAASPEHVDRDVQASVDLLPRGDVTVRDLSGAQIGSIDLDGDVFDSAHAPVGHLDRDGTVRTSSFTLLGTAREDGTLVDTNNEPLLHVDDDGVLRSPSFAEIGRIQDDGTVRDVTAKKIGEVEGYKSGLRVEVAAFIVFFGHRAIALQQ